MKFLANALEKVPGQAHENKPEYAYPDRGNKNNETFNKITSKIEDKYHLLKQETFSLLMEVSTLFFMPPAIESMFKFRKLLIEEYNNEILSEYQKLTGIELPKKD